jgi:carbamoyl-phosphate synthase large subunit
MMFDATILITAIGGSGHGEQILKAAKLAKNSKLRIVGCDLQQNAHQFAWVDEKVHLPPASHAEYMDSLVAACLKHDVQAVFHGSEPEMLKISEERELLIKHEIVPIMNSHAVISLCSDKYQTSEFLSLNGFQPPRYQILKKSDDFSGIDYFPVVVKPYRSSGGSAHVYIAQNHHELESLQQYLSAYTGLGLLVQEYVGKEDSEFTVGILRSLEGQFVSGVALKRNLKGSLSVRTRLPNMSSRKELGESLLISSGVSQGVIDDYEDLVRVCTSAAAELDSRASINFQCRVDERGVRIFEINPRLSGTTSLRALQGYNEVEYLIETEVLLRKGIDPPKARSGEIERGLVEYQV